jgi:uncharacterized protein
MTNKKIIIAGGSGFIGQALCNYFGKNNQVIVLGRQTNKETGNNFGENTIEKNLAANIQYIKWDGVTQGNWSSYINGADMVINLCGKSVNCRYNTANKKAILASRIDSTNAIATAIKNAIQPPTVWINAASATIYPFATTTARDESFTQFENDFSVEVCKAWEKTIEEAATPFTRKITLRMAIVLGNGGVMVPYCNLLKYGLGGYQGNGKQMYSWVHIHDVCSMIQWLYEHKNLQGIYNCSSPNAVNNKAFMHTLRQVSHTKFGLPAFTWILTIGAALIGTETELILKSRWVIPTKILSTGFEFKYPFLKESLQQIIHNIDKKRYSLF